MMCCTYIYNFSYLSFLKLSVFPTKGDLRLNLFSLVFFQFNPEAGDCLLLLLEAEERVGWEQAVLEVMEEEILEPPPRLVISQGSPEETDQDLDQGCPSIK